MHIAHATIRDLHGCSDVSSLNLKMYTEMIRKPYFCVIQHKHLCTCGNNATNK